jgi:hypothetical protein
MVVDVILRIEHAFRLSYCDTQNYPVPAARLVGNLLWVDIVTFEPRCNNIKGDGVGSYQGVCLELGQVVTVPYKFCLVYYPGSKKE